MTLSLATGFTFTQLLAEDDATIATYLQLLDEADEERQASGG